MKFACRMLAVGCALGMAGTAAWAQESEGAAIEDMRLPLERYAEGALKTLLTARRAVVRPQGEILATDVRVEMYLPDGALETVVTTGSCVYDRARGTVTSDAAVRMVRDDVEISGVGLRWNHGEERVRLLSETRVVLKGSIRRIREGSGP